MPRPDLRRRPAAEVNHLEPAAPKAVHGNAVWPTSSATSSVDPSGETASGTMVGDGADTGATSPPELATWTMRLACTELAEKEPCAVGADRPLLIPVMRNRDVAGDFGLREWAGLKIDDCCDGDERNAADCGPEFPSVSGRA